MHKLKSAPSISNRIGSYLMHIRHILSVSLFVTTQFMIQATVVQAQDYIHVSVRPVATFLRTNNDPPPTTDAKPINLAALGFAPGDKIRIQRIGAYSYGTAYPDTAVEMIGLFSTSDVLLPGHNQRRVTGATASAANPVSTISTYYGNLDTDIDEDFWISNAGFSEITVEIPAGAKFLFVAAPDSVYKDNSDPNNDFAVRIHYPPSPLKISLLPPLPLNGTTYIIESTPSMPVISARADVTGLSPEQNARTKITWTVKLRTKDGGGMEVDFDGVFKQNETTYGGKPYVVRLKKSDTFRGGDLTLIAKAKTATGREIEGQTSAPLTIQGRNPRRSDVQSYTNIVAQKKFGSTHKGLSLSDVQNALKRIACHESSGGGQVGQRQFKAPEGEVGPPIIAGDNGVGIFQITKTTKCNGVPFSACPDAIFNWKLNVDLAVENFKEKVASANNYPGNLIKHNSGELGKYVDSVVNPARRLAGIELIPLSQSGGKVFLKIKLPSYVTTGSFDNAGVNQLLEDAVRGNNGFKGTLFGDYMHEFRPNEDALKSLTLDRLKTDSRVWRVVNPSERQPPTDPLPVRDYVNYVRRTSAMCLNP